MITYRIRVETDTGETAEEWTRAHSIADALECADDLACAAGLTKYTATVDPAWVALHAIGVLR